MVPEALRKRYDGKSAGMICAHVTMAGPQDTERPLGDVVEAISPVLSFMEHVPLVYRGIGTFLPTTPTVFLEVQPHIRLCVFHRALTLALGWKDEFAFHPHLTLAEYVDSERAADICMELEKEPVVVKDCMKSVTVFEKTASGWLALRELHFGGAV